MNQGKACDINTHYVSFGKGEPLVFIHGVGLDHTMWKAQLDYFSSFYKVYAYDMIGHGQSDKPDKKIYSLNDYINQLKSFMDYLQIDNAHLIGFSMGGMVAQSFGIKFPNRVKTLIFSNAVANRNHQESESILNRVSKVEQQGKSSTIEAAVNRWFNEDYILENPYVVQSIRQRLETNDEKSYLKAYRLFATADQEIWEYLEEIKASVYIITGEYDKGSNPRMAKEMFDKIPNAEIYVVPDARHMLPVEKANTFNEKIHDFLKRYKEVKDH